MLCSPVLRVRHEFQENVIIALSKFALFPCLSELPYFLTSCERDTFAIPREFFFLNIECFPTLNTFCKIDCSQGFFFTDF